MLIKRLMKYLTSKHKTLRLLYLIPLFFLISCDQKNRGEWLIADVSRDTLLIAETDVKTPTTLLLKISGQVDDSIEVSSIKIPGGKIEEELRYDHYYPKIEVNFKSYKAKKGSLRVKYYLP